jgi:hypothetical protein
MFANVRVRLKMFAYGPVPREAVNEPLPFHPDEAKIKISQLVNRLMPRRNRTVSQWNFIAQVRAGFDLNGD